MRIGDHIYFAPDILLKDIEIDSREFIIAAFQKRVESYYLKPIRNLNMLKSAFAVGIIEFSMIDALARYSTNNNRVGDRIKEMLQINFGTTKEIASRAYEEFRNGLLHENHIKNCGQFCYETEWAFEVHSDCLIINPQKLYIQLTEYFKEYIDLLMTDNMRYETFIINIKRDFKDEVEFFKNM